MLHPKGMEAKLGQQRGAPTFHVVMPRKLASYQACQILVHPWEGNEWLCWGHALERAARSLSTFCLAPPVSQRSLPVSQHSLALLH